MSNAPSLRVPSYRRHKPTGQAVVTINGRDLYLGKWNTQASRTEYDRLIAEFLSNGRQLKGSIDRTVVEVLNAYRKYAESYYRKDGRLTSEYGVIKDALKLVRELYGRTIASEFGPLALKAVRQRMIDRGWSRGTINKSIGRVRRCFKWAVENELVRPDGSFCLVSGKCKSDRARSRAHLASFKAPSLLVILYVLAKCRGQVRANP